MGRTQLAESLPNYHKPGHPVLTRTNLKFKIVKEKQAYKQWAGHNLQKRCQIIINLVILY